jgi:nitrogenase molybdenum-iron protein alpha/beta subunit
MGLYKSAAPSGSGRMGALWTLSNIAESAVVKFGCMGHMAYGRTFLHRIGSFGARLYSTHISESDIAMGDTSRLSMAIEHIVKQDKVKAVFLLPSAVPEIIGVDLAAIAREMSPQLPDIKIISLPVGGFDVCEHRGIEQTLLLLAQTLPKDTAPTQQPTFNIIGSCADMFRFHADSREVSRLASNAFSMKRLCAMTFGTSISELEQMGGAHINLVIRREGEPAARHLRQRFGTPYLLCRPYGISGTLDWIGQVERLSEIPADKEYLRREKERVSEQISAMRLVFSRFLRAHRYESKLVLAGHADVLAGIAACGKEIFGFDEYAAYCDCPDMADADTVYLAEQAKAKLAKDRRGFLMGSGELLRMANRDKSLQIANPDDLWRHAYEPPLVGLRGAVNLAAIWSNEIMRKI